MARRAVRVTRRPDLGHAAGDDPYGDQSSACGRAADLRKQTAIEDVDRDPAFAPHRPIAGASGFRAVQSTPLVDGKGRLRGVMSTHFRRPHRPAAGDLQLMQWYGERVAAVLARGSEHV